jgi:hypothetical protein
MDPSGILKSVEIGSMGLDRITFGKSVVGMMTTSFISMLAVFGPLAITGVVWGQPNITYICIAVIIVAFLFTAISIMIFASRHPTSALLEGAEIVRLRQVEMAAKGLSLPMTQPNTEPPMIEAVETNDENVQPKYKVD